MKCAETCMLRSHQHYGRGGMHEEDNLPEVSCIVMMSPTLLTITVGLHLELKVVCSIAMEWQADEDTIRNGTGNVAPNSQRRHAYGAW